MINRKFFCDQARVTLFDGKLTQKQVDGMLAILDGWEKDYANSDDRWLAYALATAHHETDRTMQPIREYGRGSQRTYGRRIKMSGKPYFDTQEIFYGRGLVQLTWYENYKRAGDELGFDFLHQADAVMQPDIAVAIMFKGMTRGWFTGKRLSDYFSAAKEDWTGARRIINGIDKASLIAGYGLKYYAAISHTTA